VHTGELRFLEIRRDPDFIGLRYKHEGLSRLDSGTQLDASLADDPFAGA